MSTIATYLHFLLQLGWRHLSRAPFFKIPWRSLKMSILIFAPKYVDPRTSNNVQLYVAMEDLVRVSFIFASISRAA